jgi:hypothetical protein
VEYGEKNNSYFLGLEKQRQIKKSINKLIDENNEILTDQMHILSTIKSYYEKLYPGALFDFILFIALEHSSSVTFPSQID